jgi:hypothetical protein
MRFIFIVLFFLISACNSDVGLEGDLVGGACRDDRDCARECLRGGDYPDGMCSVYCFDDRDCPAGTACIDKSGGVCALYCDVNADCRRGYVCDDIKRRGAPGEEWVCFGD